MLCKKALKMALRIRLARGGSKHRPFYHIVVAENTAPRDGRFVEKLGFYNPLLPHENSERFVVNNARAKYWMSVGAQPTERVQKLLASKGICDAPVIPNRPKKSAPKKKAQERMARDAEASEIK